MQVQVRQGRPLLRADAVFFVCALSLPGVLGAAIGGVLLFQVDDV